jgi:hypothetical protein
VFEHELAVVTRNAASICRPVKMPVADSETSRAFGDGDLLLKHE